MAQANQQYDWSNTNSLRHRAWESIKEFFGKEEEEHPLSPDNIMDASGEGTGSGAIPPLDQANTPDLQEDRRYRQTERQNISNSPHTTWPG